MFKIERKPNVMFFRNLLSEPFTIAGALVILFVHVAETVGLIFVVTLFYVVSVFGISISAVDRVAVSQRESGREGAIVSPGVPFIAAVALASFVKMFPVVGRFLGYGHPGVFSSIFKVLSDVLVRFGSWLSGLYIGLGNLLGQLYVWMDENLQNLPVVKYVAWLWQPISFVLKKLNEWIIIGLQFNEKLIRTGIPFMLGSLIKSNILAFIFLVMIIGFTAAYAIRARQNHELVFEHIYNIPFIHRFIYSIGATGAAVLNVIPIFNIYYDASFESDLLNDEYTDGLTEYDNE